MNLQEWHIANLADIAEPGAVEFRVGEDDWPFRGFIVRWQGQVYAYTNTCPHTGHPLNINPDGFFSLDMMSLLCTSHGALFEPDTGLCIGGPCSGAKLKALECRIDNGRVVVYAPDSMHQE